MEEHRVKEEEEREKGVERGDTQRKGEKENSRSLAQTVLSKRVPVRQRRLRKREVHQRSKSEKRKRKEEERRCSERWREKDQQRKKEREK